MPPLGANYEEPQHPRPYPLSLCPDTRECKHREGGIVRLQDGVPVVVREEDSPRLGLHDYQTPNELSGILSYLKVEIEYAQGDAKRLVGTFKLLKDIRTSCWWWYSKSESWGSGSFQLERTEVMKEMKKRNLKSLEQDFWTDISAGLKAIAKIYPEFVDADKN